jgi:hypothetical protein
MSVYIHVFHNTGASTIQEVWNYYLRESIVTVGFRKKGREWGKIKKLDKYNIGDEIFLYAKDENYRKNRGFVGYAKVDSTSVYRYVKFPFETLNSPIDHPHILPVKYLCYVTKVEERIPFKDIKELLGITPGHLRHTVVECKPKQYDVKAAVNKLRKPPTR